jgi:osmotically inducible protein OsmC
MAIRTASASWQGTLTEGTGVMRTGKGGYEGNYSFHSRFEEGEGTNPEELIGAAHAGCFSMALSAELGKAGLHPQSVETAADLTLEMLPGGPTTTAIHLRVNAVVPGADKAKFDAAAEAAKQGCPISRLLNTKITMDAKLASQAHV